MDTQHNAGQPQGLAARTDLDAQYQWDLSAIFSSDDAWEVEFAAIQAEVARIRDFEGTLAQSSSRLLEWLQFQDALDIRFGKIGNYAFRRYDEDTANARYQEYMNRVIASHAALDEALSWVTPELIAIPETVLASFFEENDGLEIYRHALESVQRMKPHTRSREEEQLLALGSELTTTPGLIFGMFNDADISFPPVEDEEGNTIEVTKGRYIQLQESLHRSIRQKSYESMYSTYHTWRNTLAATLAGQVKQSVYVAKTRMYASSRDAELFPDNIPTAVYDNVVTAINDNLEPLHRSVELRRRALELETIMPWDLYVPLVQEFSREVPYQEAADTVRASVAILGEEYAHDLAKAFTDGWIDVYENKGKRSGAYSAWTYGCHPFVLLNYTDTLKDMFTLAHELGHSMHSYYTWKNQPPVYGGYTIFCAEVASTCNEILLLHHLLQQNPPPELRLQLLLHQIDTIRGTVYNQALFAEFEQAIHFRFEQGHPLTADVFDEIMAGLYTRYYGEAFTMHDLYKANWSRIPHFYRSFYVFQYATGFSAAAALADGMIQGAPDARERYLNFLKSGSSAYSIDLLQRAGVDMTSPAPIEATARLMASLLDEAEQLLDPLGKTR